MKSLISTPFCKSSNLFNYNPLIYSNFTRHYGLNSHFSSTRRFTRVQASTNDLDNNQNVAVIKDESTGSKNIQEISGFEMNNAQENDQVEVQEKTLNLSSGTPFDKDLKKVVQKTAATFAPRASVASKNPAVPGSTLYAIFEVQGYISMLLGGVLSFNLIFPSNEPDIWRLMGMWSIWMFTIPSLRARDCSKNEKEALNYLFLLIPVLNVIIPFFLKSFAVVWSADTVAFFAMYAWKMGWLQPAETE